MDTTFDIRLRELKSGGRRLLICYLPLGDPALGDRAARAQELVSSGADVLELGLPYRNPELDGPVVGDSMRRALESDPGSDPYSDIRRIRESSPNALLQVMTYWELISEMGCTLFADRVADAGADAVLCPNIPRHARNQLSSELGRRGLPLLNFVPFDCAEGELERVASEAEGYVFLQAVNGKTGVSKTAPSARVGASIQCLRRYGATVPLCAGFGISSPEDVALYLSMGADGVIIGSALLLAMLRDDARGFLAPIREVLDEETLP